MCCGWRSNLLQFIILLLSHIGASGSGGFNYAASSLTIDDGLSNNNVTTIFQDQSGYMWFGTYDGVNIFDGYEFHILRHQYEDEASLLNDRIVSVCQDLNENVWIGTKSGLSIQNNLVEGLKKAHYIRFGTDEKKELRTAVTNIERDQEGNMLIGTDGLGVLFSRSGSFILEQIPYQKDGEPFSDYHVRGIVNRGTISWVFVEGVGLCKTDQRDKKLQVINTTVRGANNIAADPRGFLWIGTDNGLYKYDIQSDNYTYFGEKEGLSSDKIVALCVTKNGGLWIGSDGGGVDILTEENKFLNLAEIDKRFQTLSRSVFAIYEDEEDRIWIGTLRGGIILLDPNKPNFKNIRHNPADENSLISDYISSFCEDRRHRLWIGTDGGGLSIYDEDDGKYTNYTYQQGQTNGLSSNFIMNICEDHNGNIWLGTWGGGINRYNPVKKGFDHYKCLGGQGEEKNVFALCEDHANNLWAGSVGGGLFRYNASSDQFELFDNSNRDVILIFEDKDLNLWIGTFTSLVRINREGGSDRTYDIGRPVRAVSEGDDGTLWVGTEGGGLVSLDQEKGIIRRYTVKDGLPSDVVLNILKDADGDLWMSTYNGLSKFNISENRFENYYKNDGIQSNQFNYNAAAKLRSGAFIFGGINGYTSFDPKDIKAGETVTNVLVNQILVDNKPLYENSKYVTKTSGNIVQEIKVPYNKVIQIGFVGINYRLTGELSYAYYLGGTDFNSENTKLNWNQNGKSRSISFPHLRAGSYGLRIRAEGLDNQFLGNEALLKITVSPPWYASKLAFFLYAFLIAAGIFTYISYRTRRARLKYELKLAQMNEKKEKEINEKKLNYFTNVTHDFRTPLTLIINPLKDIIKGNDRVDHILDLKIVYNNAKRMLSLVDQLLYFKKIDKKFNLKITTVDFYPLCKNIYDSFILLAKNKGIQYDLFFDDTQLKIECDKRKVETVLYNLLSNAFKHTKRGGEITFSVIKDHDWMIASIADTGRGISSGVGEKIFEKFYQESRGDTNEEKTGFGIGLHVVKRLVEKHKGTVYYESALDQGTTFYVKMPLMQDREGFLVKDAKHKEGNSPVHIETTPSNNEKEPATPKLIYTQKSLLIIEDDVEMRNYIKKIFLEKFRIIEASNGEQGLRLAKQTIPDIMISDIMMDGKDGIELCKMIKQNSSLNHIPIILMTGSMSDNMRLKSIEGGADAYITKPFDKEILLARVDNLIKNRNDLQRYFYNKVTFKEDDLNISSEDKELIDACIEIVEKYCGEDGFNIEMISKEMGMSHSNLYKKVKAITGQSLNGFIRYIRLRKGAELMIKKAYNVNQAAFEVGFSDLKYFRERFKDLFGMSPSEYKKQFENSFSEVYRINRQIFKDPIKD